MTGRTVPSEIAQPNVRPSAWKVTGPVPGVYIQETSVSGRYRLS